MTQQHFIKYNKHDNLWYILEVMVCRMYNCHPNMSVTFRPQPTSDITRTRTYPTFWSSFVRTYLPTPTRPYGIFKSHFLLELSTVYQIFVQCVLELWKKCKKCCESTKKLFFVDSQQFFSEFLNTFHTKVHSKRSVWFGSGLDIFYQNLPTSTFARTDRADPTPTYR